MHVIGLLTFVLSLLFLCIGFKGGLWWCLCFEDWEG